MRSQQRTTMLFTIATGTLGGCGAGIGGDFVAIEPPPPRPPEWVAPLDARTTQDLAVLTLDGSEDEIALRYDAERGLYLMSYPGAPEGALRLLYEDGYGIHARLAHPASGAPNASTDITFYRAADNDPEYSVRGHAYSLSGSSAYGNDFLAAIPTAPGDVPVTGSATFAISGYSAYSSVEGEMAFDFAAGALDGFFDVAAHDDWGEVYWTGHYDFLDAIYATGDTRFSGSLVNADDEALGGDFFGLFAGPGAQELIGHYTFEYRTGEGETSIFSVNGLFSGQRN